LGQRFRRSSPAATAAALPANRRRRSRRPIAYRTTDLINEGLDDVLRKRGFPTTEELKRQ
jgi:hypothetical protein